MRRLLVGATLVLCCSTAHATTDCLPEWLGKPMGQIEDMMEAVGQLWRTSLERDPNGRLWLVEHYDGIENGVVITYPVLGDTLLPAARVECR